MKSGEQSSLSIFNRGMSRREFFAAGLVTAAACLFPHKAVAAASRVFSPERVLSFYNTHTGENLKTVYWNRGTYVPEGLADINAILRDFRTGETKEIDTGLLNLLYVLHEKLEAIGPFHIISGYRSPETNAFLNMISRGVVRNSLHIQGKAIDIRLPGHELRTVQRAALDLQGGGVGYYPASDFVHVDVGRPRSW